MAGKKSTHPRLAMGIALLALLACKKGNEGNASATASATPPPAPSATAEAPKVEIPERAVGSGWTSDKLRFVQAFKFGLPESAPVGASFKDARAACAGIGRDLCGEEQWELACATDATVAKAASWTITPAGATGWRVRGGSSCDARSDATDGSAVPARIGLCCERRAAISTSKNRQEAVMKAAQTYIGIVEQASSSGSPAEVSKLLAPSAKLFKTNTTPDQAKKNLADDWRRWPQQDVRFYRCVADAAGSDGNFECDAVGTRTPASTNIPELSVFQVRFEYEDFKYTVFADPTLIRRKWAPY